MTGEIVVIELTETIERAIPVLGCVNQWPAGTRFQARRNIVHEGWTVTYGPDAGLGIPPDCAEEVQDSFPEYDADCPACLRRLPHTQQEHEAALQRCYEASQP